MTVPRVDSPAATGSHPRWPYAVLALGMVAAVLAGAGLGYFMRFDQPDVGALEDYNPPEMTRVLAADGALVATFAEERRILIEYNEIPLVFRQALIAVEDANFHRHTGIDMKGIARALWRDVSTLSMAQGASTLTQQLARNLFLHREKTIRRKVQEVMLALEIERQYTKPEILRYYCNQIYTGHGRWGIEAASRYYFGKPAREMTLTEAATLAGLIQRPESLSPFNHPERARQRRNFVLRRMVDVGFLSVDEGALAQQEPLQTVRRRQQEKQGAPYFVEEVRRWLQERYGSSGVYKEGLEVRSTLDPVLQGHAERALATGLRQLDKRQGWRGAAARVPDGEDPRSWSPASWQVTPEEGQVVDAVVIEVDAAAARVRVAGGEGRLDRAAIAWTDQSDPRKLFQVGDVVRVRLDSIADETALRISLEQKPLVQAALLAIEPATGAIRALIGGFDFETSEFDRAMQAKRQTGSVFKPFIYAAALRAGFTLADTLLDEPTVFLNSRLAEPYQPENYTHKYYGTITLRVALERSANIATVKLLDRVGYGPVIETARSLGIGGELRQFPSLALGAYGATLLDLTAAYGTFANQGVWVEPHLVSEVFDRSGTPLARIEPEVRDAVEPEIAFLMNQMLSGVVSDGTGRAAAALGHPLAGKTGTTDDNTDAWFIGYSTRLAVGVWVGFDEPRSLGTRETGAQAALPIWLEFMRAALQGQPKEEFPEPPGIAVAAIDRRTGLRADADAGCATVIPEVFLEGTEPSRYCSRHRHEWVDLPYPFQRYALNDNGELELPEGDLDGLLAEEVDVFLVDGGRRIEAYRPEGLVSLPLRIVPGGGSDPLTVRMRQRYDVSRWVGRDGRTAEILWIN